MSLTWTPLYQSGILKIRYVTCRPSDQKCGEIEESHADVIVLPLSGMFIKHLDHEKKILAEPTQALFFAAGRSYQVSHMITGGDDCLALEFSSEIINGILKDAIGVDTLLAIEPNCLLKTDAIAVRSIFSQRLQRKIVEPMEAEEVSLGLVSTAIRSANKRNSKRWDVRQLRRLELIDAARIALIKEQDKCSLTSLAGRLGCSPYHLTRIFRQQVGIPLYQFLLKSRIAKTIDALLDTKNDITTIALEYGFTSHSHYSAVFKKFIGVPPHEFRLTTSKMRKNLIARLLPNPLN